MKIKAFLDTNIFLDLILENRPSTPASNVIFQSVFNGGIEAVITTQSILDACFVHGTDCHANIESFFKNVVLIMDYVNMDHISEFDLRWAAKNYSGDFEDDAQVARALDTCCDVFVTNDKKLRNRYNGKHEHLRFMSPEEIVSKMRGEATPSHI